MALFDKTGLLVLTTLLALVTIVSVTLAYTETYDPYSSAPLVSTGVSTGPPVFGHSADEINVYSDGEIKTLQQAFNESYIPESYNFTLGSTGFVACSADEVTVSEIHIPQNTEDDIYLRLCAKTNA